MKNMRNNRINDRKYNEKYGGKHSFSSALSLVLVFVFFILFYLNRQPSLPDSMPSPASEAASGTVEIAPNRSVDLSLSYPVTEIIDGDTLKVEISGQIEKIRLLQVNAPELSAEIPMGAIAADFVRGFIGDQPIFLEFDQELRDQYGRLLCYVYIEKEASRLCLNEALVKSGMAKVVKYGKNIREYEHYKQLEAEARNKKIGIWQDYNASFPK